MASIINAATSGGLITTADTSGILQLQTAGTTAVTVDASQNVGVGTASPTKKLDILSNTSQDGIRISGSTNPRLTIIDTTTPVQFDALCTDTEAVLRTDTNHPLVLSSNGTERMRLPAAGGVQAVTTISVGNATPSASGAGITFPATQSASSDANTLDDYEEGTWTPTITSQSGSMTAYTSAGIYVKVGKSVTVSFGFTITTAGTASGVGSFSGLPFQGATAPVGNRLAIGVIRENAATGNLYYFYITSASTTGDFITITNGAITWSNTYQYIFTITYQSNS